MPTNCSKPSNTIEPPATTLLHAFVVMPDHIHVLITPQAITLERTVQLIKGGFSHRIASKSPIWQRGFTDHRIRDAEDFNIRRDYIHQNPVRAGHVASAELYPYSSAFRSGPTTTLHTFSGASHALPTTE